MPSPLRLQSVIDTQSTQSYYPTKAASPAKKQKMSLTQTYYIASTARTKLGREASRSDHDLRLLVGHANLLDVLMVELQEAEKEQEAWFNESLRKNTKPEQPRHVQWIDSIAEEYEEDSDSESDSDSEDIYDEEDAEFTVPAQSEYTVTSREIEEDEEDFEQDFEDMEYDEEHALTRVVSHPPELIHEDSSDSEDESMPTSPNAELDLEYQPTQPITTTPYGNKKIDQHDDFHLADSIMIQQRSGPMISAY